MSGGFTRALREAPPMATPLDTIPNQVFPQLSGVVLDGSPPVVQDNTPTFPGAPFNFTAISMWAYPEWFTVDASADIQTIDTTIYVPTQITPGQWQGFFDQVKAFALSEGITVVGYEVDEETALDVTIPTQFCVDANDCFAIPGQICIPFTSICLAIAGQTIATAYAYRLWIVVSQQSVSGLAVRAFLPGIAAAIAIVILIVGLGFGILTIYSLATGHLTFQQFTDQVKNLASAPGQVIVPAIQNAEWPLIALGAIAIIAGVGIPALTLGGGLTGPGGVGGHLNVGTGAIAPAPARRT